MLSTERKIYLINKLDREGILHVKDVAIDLTISETTIRRDLMELEKEHKVKRVHGGAVKPGFDHILTESNDTLMSERMSLNADIKSKICFRASQLIQDGECIFLDGGTSIVSMIDYLWNRPVKIVTHSHLIVQRLTKPVAEIIIIGGEYNAKYKMSEGPIAQNMLRLYNFDRAFIGCAGVDLEAGQCYTAEMGTRELKEIAMKRSNHNYLLIDDRKLFIKGFCGFVDIERFEQVFCNESEELGEDIPSNFVLVK